MMSTVSVEVELVGGPADGRRMAVNGDPMDPPLALELAQAPAMDMSRTDNEPVMPGKLLYRRAANPGTAGPLWHYHFETDTPQT